MGQGEGFAALRSRNYVLYLAGHSVSHTGTAIEATATSWLLYLLTDSPVLLGLGGLARMLPIVLLVLVDGAVADQFPKRQVLFITQLGLGLLSGIVGAIILAGLIEPWHLFVYIVLSSTLLAFDVPARQSLFPSLVSPAQLPSAVRLNSLTARIAMLVGPMLGGVLIAAVHPASPYLGNTFSYVWLMGALAAMRSVPVARRSVMSARMFAATILDGLQFVRRAPVLRPLMLVELVVSGLGHNNALLTIFARDVLTAGPEGLGLLRSSVAAGALMAMAVLLSAPDTERKGLLMWAAGLLYASSLVGFALSGTLWLSCMLLVGLGFADALWAVTRNTLIQVLSPEVMRGRVNALKALVGRGMTAASEVQTGALVALLGPAGAGVLAGTGIIVAVLRLIRRSQRVSSHEAPEPL